MKKLIGIIVLTFLYCSPTFAAEDNYLFCPASGGDAYHIKLNKKSSEVTIHTNYIITINQVKNLGKKKFKAGNNGNFSVKMKKGYKFEFELRGDNYLLKIENVKFTIPDYGRCESISKKLYKHHIKGGIWRVLPE